MLLILINYLNQYLYLLKFYGKYDLRLYSKLATF
jgi:hypothetical protein